MGREALCKCDWAGTKANVKALLETSELILRGEMRKRVALADLRDVKAQSDRLCFEVAGEPVQLFLGADQASKWAKAIQAGAVPLARKLGIKRETVVRAIGAIEDEALKSALHEAARISSRDADLVVAVVETAGDLHEALKSADAQIAKGVPIWLVYPKGPGHALNESLVRTALLARGMVDTKVAAVSAKLTAMRFNPRRGT
jgi:Protein of unknown function (DUF3052)